MFLTQKLLGNIETLSAWAWKENCFVIDFSINERNKFVLRLVAGGKMSSETRLMVTAKHTNWSRAWRKNSPERMLFRAQLKTQHTSGQRQKRKLSFFASAQDGTRDREMEEKNHLQSERR